MITESLNTASDPLGPKMVDGDFKALGDCWSTLSTPNYVLAFAESIQQDCWTQIITDKTKEYNILG